MVAVCGALVGAGIALILRPAAIAQIRLQDPSRPQRSEQDGFFGVYLPTDRSLSRAMSRVRERLAEREFHQSLTFLQQVLQREEDAFLDESENAQQQLGLKATARQLIGQLPPEGLDAYERLHGAAARRQLDTALAAGDSNGVAAVVRQFFHTAAGYEAALVLAQMEADQGHHLAAAQIYQELLAAPRAATQFEPQLSALAARNFLAANEPEAATATLRALIEKHPGGTLELFGKKETLPAAGDELSRWLVQRIGQPLPAALSDSNWLTGRGDASRNAARPGGRPHLRTRWEARVVNDPGIETHLMGRREEFAERGIVTIPAARPIALDNLVVMRTPRNVVAVDWETGKRVWETRDDEELDPSDAVTGLPGGADDEQFTIQGGPFEQRMWDDSLVMSLTSDGERIYVLRGDTITTQDEFFAMQMAPNFNRRMPDMSAMTNRLAAYDVRTEGKLLWELDGARTTGELSGAFILGPPLAVDGTLFVMVEVRSAAYLVALDPATGRVRWQQQLVGLELGIALDPSRRRVGTTPSYAGGILVCPTAAGAVVAIDIVRREFAWVYRYRRENATPGDFRNAFQPQIQNQLARSNDRWLDSSAIIVENRVFITPPESDDVHCIDLQSGKHLWSQRKLDALFVGGVDEERVLLVEPESVRALHVANGMPAWDKFSVPLPSGAIPAGHGYLSDGTYYLPLTSGEIAAIDLASGDITQLEAGPQGQMLGNLICFRGSVLSQSAVTLNKFEQFDALQQRATTALAQNPNDATALREFAELRQAEGKRKEAIDALKRALELEPQDRLVRDMLAGLLLEALADDFGTHRGDLALLSDLVRDRNQQLDMLRLEAEGLQKLGERVSAWNAYLRIADLSAEEPTYLEISRDYTVRSDRWICSRLGQLWAEAAPDEHSVFAAQLAERRNRLQGQATSAELRHYLRHFAFLPGASDVRRELTEFLIEHKRSAEAQIELLEMSTAADKSQRAVAAALMTKLLVSSPNPADAAAWRSLLQEEFDDTVVLDGLSGKEWLAQLAATSSLPQSSGHDWPRGQIEAETIQTATPLRERPRGSRIPERQTGLRPLRIEQDFGPVAPSIQWYIAADCSALVGRNPLGDDVFHLALNQNNFARQHRNSDLVYAARLGDQLFVALGGQVIAIDTRQNSVLAEGSLLWQAKQAGQFPAITMRGRRLTRAQQFRPNRRPIYHTWSSRKRAQSVAGTVVGPLGPVTPRGVVYQDENELKCVDPLSGETLWWRSDLPAGCELFGDQEFVFAADVSEREAYQIRIVDGHLVGKRELPPSEWMLTAGRNVAQLGVRTGEGRELLLRITDVAAQETLFDAEYPPASATTVVEPNAVAVLEPNGKFQLIDVQSGQLIIDTQLEPIPALGGIQISRFDETLFLLVSTKASRQRQQQQRPVDQLDNLPTSGFVYAFNLETGAQQWPGAATIHNRGLVAQPDGLPFLVFLDRQTISDGARGARRRLRLLCVDKKTGKTVYRKDDLPDTPVTRLRIRGELEDAPHVTIETNAGTIRLALTDRPQPPRPPANDELEASQQRSERGLVGLGQRMGAALRGGILQDGQPNQRQAPEQIDDD